MRNNVSERLEQFALIELSEEMIVAEAKFAESRKAYGEGLDKIVALTKENRDAEALAMTAINGFQ